MCARACVRVWLGDCKILSCTGEGYTPFSLQIPDSLKKFDSSLGNQIEHYNSRSVVFHGELAGFEPCLIFCKISVSP